MVQRNLPPEQQARDCLCRFKSGSHNVALAGWEPSMYIHRTGLDWPRLTEIHLALPSELFESYCICIPFVQTPQKMSVKLSS